ncbi:DUF892 family protein [Leucobacter sp. CSA1]|uniref:DUF892 family protein n=1 Tax=Leucobacter chromiisoli TaxID=2796471 RepID=A0A934UUN4_9MICO|nr:DUF892 family protein [Leucobacter chromiisoli]MBK0419000.1 DUF892 family protein [Leucobacter chromiisoli]
MTQQNLETPEELIHFQLRSALTMEQHSFEALEELHSAARSSDVKHLFTHHADETKEQIANLEKVFQLFDFRESTAPSPATTGIKNQAASLIERTDPKLHDQVTLMSALGNEHFEISAYQGLILQAQALRAPDAVSLLQANLDQETHTSEELHDTLRDLLS